MADRVITISDFSRNALIEHYGVDPRKVVRIYLGAESDFYADYGRAGPPRLDGIPRRYVFYPANRWKHKNHRTLLETIRILNEQYRDDVSLVLTGDDPRDGFDVIAESRRLGIGDRVISLGFVDKPTSYRCTGTRYACVIPRCLRDSAYRWWRRWPSAAR